MFNTITWELFVTTVISLAGAYYLICIALLYHQEITRWWKPRNTRSRASSPATQQVASSVMGPIDERDNAMSKTHVTLPSIEKVTDALIGTVSDLLQEIKSLIKLTVENNWDKEQTESLFRTLLARYPSLKGTSHQQSVSAFIVDAATDEFPFAFSADEVMTWWQ